MTNNLLWQLLTHDTRHTMFDTSRFSPSALNILFRRLQSRFAQVQVSSPLTFAFLVVLLTLPAMWPFFANTGYWVSHDGLFHLYRLLSLEEAWQQGYVYPRTFPDFAFGYGFAVLNFYGPLTYYIALIMKIVGFSPVGAMKATFALSYSLSALAVWWLVRDVWRQNRGHYEEWAGLVAAIVYTYVPYHVADVQLRGALAESWAFVWWPLLFWAVWRMRWWRLTFALAALVLTHNLSVVLVAFPLTAWALLALWYSRDEFRQNGKTHTADLALTPPTPPLPIIGEGGVREACSPSPIIGRGGWGVRAALRLKSLLHLGLVCLVALAMTAFYWLPVLLESQYVAIAQDVGGFGFERHLAPLETWITAEPSYHYFPNQGVQAEHPLSWPQVGLVGLALLIGMTRFSLSRDDQSSHSMMVFFFWLLIFGGVIFLLTPLSLTLWQTFVFPFGLIQYPWRWLGIGSLASAMLVSYAFVSLKDNFRRINVTLFLVLLSWLVFASLQHLPWPPQEVDVTRHPVQMWQEDAANGQVGATWTAEFLPLTVKEQRWALARAPEQIDTSHVGQRSALRIKRAGGDGFTFWADVEATEPSRLVFPRFAYPSMQASIRPLESSPTFEMPISVTPTGVMGLASIEVPEGVYHVQLAAYPLANQPLLLWGLGILSLALVIYGITRWSKWGLLCLSLIVLLFFLTREPDLTTSFDPPPLFGTQVQLVTLRHSSTPAKAGTLFPLRLGWFNLEQTDQFYSTFVHLTALGGGAPLASHDSQPNMATVPTPRWLAGQLIEDLHLLSLPEGLAPGEYELWGGIYTFQDEVVVPIAGDSGERRFLGVIEVR